MKRPFRTILVSVICLSFLLVITVKAEQSNTAKYPPTVKAAFIKCKGMVDDNLYKFIREKSQLALNNGSKYLIYEIATVGGFLEAADDISKYLILEINKKAHSVAHVTNDAIGAAAMISVSCNDIIMRENTTIGNCVPIGSKWELDSIELVKAESFTRAAFARAAEANDYPEALLKAMVTIYAKVYRVKNQQTGKYEFFNDKELPYDSKKYDLDNKELIVNDDEILTLTDSKALEYGINRARANDRAGVLEYLVQRDGVTLSVVGVYDQFGTESDDVEGWMNIVFVLTLGGVWLIWYIVRKQKQKMKLPLESNQYGDVSGTIDEKYKEENMESTKIIPQNKGVLGRMAVA